MAPCLPSAQLDGDVLRGLDEKALRLSTTRSWVDGGKAMASLRFVEITEPDLRLQESYRRLPQDPAIVVAAGRLAAENALPW